MLARRGANTPHRAPRTTLRSSLQGQQLWSSHAQDGRYRRRCRKLNSTSYFHRMVRNLVSIPGCRPRANVDALLTHLYQAHIYHGCRATDDWLSGRGLTSRHQAWPAPRRAHGSFSASTPHCLRRRVEYGPSTRVCPHLTSRRTSMLLGTKLVMRVRLLKAVPLTMAKRRCGGARRHPQNLALLMCASSRLLSLKHMPGVEPVSRPVT